LQGLTNESLSLGRPLQQAAPGLLMAHKIPLSDGASPPFHSLKQARFAGPVINQLSDTYTLLCRHDPQ